MAVGIKGFIMVVEGELKGKVAGDIEGYVG